MKNVILSILILFANLVCLSQNSYPSSGNVKIFGADEAWAEGICVVKASGWSGLRLARNNPSGGNYDGNWAIGYNYFTGNDFSISNNYGGAQYNGIFHISASTRNVGIGTTSPNGNLHIVGSRASMMVQNTNAGDWSFLRVQGSGSNLWDIAQFGNNDFLEFRPNGGDVNRVVIKQSGNVGIGTISPSQKLEVNGSILQNAENTALGVDNIGDSRLGFIKKAGLGPVLASSSGSPIVFSQSNQSGIYTNIGGSILTERMRIDATGNVGIGTTQPDQKLTVNGTVHATRVKIETTVPGPDYVFEKSYSLPSLDEVKSYIDKNKHLPEVPSAKEMEAKGIDVGEMNMLLLKKVEELTLYVIELKKELNELKSSHK